MTTSMDMFNGAELALAAYADLESSIATINQKQKLLDAGMTDTQAERFIVRWPEVVTQYKERG